MGICDQIYAQTLLLAGPVAEEAQELLRSLCDMTMLQLRARLRPGLTPEDCQGAFAAAAGLYTLAEFETLRQSQEPETMTVGEVTLRRSGQGSAADCLRAQADMIMSPFLQDRFVFRRV